MYPALMTSDRCPKCDEKSRRVYRNTLRVWLCFNDLVKFNW